MPGCGRRLAYLIRNFDLGFYVSFVSPLILSLLFLFLFYNVYIYLSDLMCFTLSPCQDISISIYLLI